METQLTLLDWIGIIAGGISISLVSVLLFGSLWGVVENIKKHLDN